MAANMWLLDTRNDGLGFMATLLGRDVRLFAPSMTLEPVALDGNVQWGDVKTCHGPHLQQAVAVSVEKFNNNCNCLLQLKRKIYSIWATGVCT